MAVNSCFKFAFQGVRGAFSHRAGLLFAQQSGSGNKVEAIPCETFVQIFEQVQSKQCGYGVIPLENSSVGSIVANYDLLWSHPLSLIGEFNLPVHHQLIGLPGTKLETLTQVYSHPVALDQCRKFFAQHPQLQPVSYFDTSGSVAYVKEQGNPNMAAIASDFAAAEYEMEILVKDIEDYAGNCTRFGIITADTVTSLPTDTPYKLSCVAELAHQPGSLAKLLSALADAHVNLTKIESRPIPESPAEKIFQYRFFIDIELNNSNSDEMVVAALTDNCQQHRVLGRYLPAAL